MLKYTYNLSQTATDWRRIVFAGGLIILSLATTVQAQTNHILYINSYHRGYLWSDGIEQGLWERLQASGKKIDVYVEFLDTKRFPDLAYLAKLSEVFAMKHGKVSYDAIIVSDNAAFEFAVQYREQLFPHSPLIFCGYNSFRPEAIKGITNVTGVNEEIDFAGTIDMALTVHPKTRTLIFVTSDYYTAGQLNQAVVETTLIPAYRDRYQILQFKNFHLQELEQRLSALPPDALVFIFGQPLDNRDAQFIGAEEFYRRAAAASVAPAYSFWDFILNTGMMGGRIITGPEQGRMVADLTLKVLDGVPADSIPVVMETPTSSIFDFNAMRRFGVSEQALPAGSIVINRPDTFYQKYKPYVWITISVFALLSSLSLILAFLLRQSHRLSNSLHTEIVERQKVENELQQHREHLEELIAERTAELRESENRLRTIFETSQAGIILTDPRGVITFANQRMADLFKCTLPELIGSIYPEHISPDEREVGEDNIRRLIAGEIGTIALERHYLCADGSDFWGLLSSRRLEDEQGNLAALVGIIVDISDRKQAEAVLQQAKDAAEAANQAKSAFLANMSHELRTPLNAIIGFTHLLRHNSDIPSREQEHLRIIQRNGEHLLTLINQILDFSKIEAERMVLNPKPFDLPGLLEDMYDLFVLNARQKGLPLNFHRAADLPRMIRTDEVKLRQVLMNLLSNAIKFTQAGGVTVRVECQSSALTGESRACAPRLTQAGGVAVGVECQSSALTGESRAFALRFEVEDTGPGILPEDQAHLFEVFTQATAGRQAQQGTGLGLAISRKFVQLMGGDIRVSSEIGRGTTFSFEIQVERLESLLLARPQSTLPGRVIALEPGQPLYRLLVVDDIPDNRLLLRKLLQRVGFEVREAANGQEAIDCWRDWQPHLIWMDLRMSGLDGYEATQQIKTTLQGQQTKVIVVSASLVDDDRLAVLAAGCDDFLRKPFQEADIFTLLEKHLDLRFIYEQEEPRQIDQEPLSGGDILAAAIAAVPSELLEELKRATKQFDFNLMLRTIDTIRVSHPSAAKSLEQLANNFDYERILTVIQQE